MPTAQPRRKSAATRIKSPSVTIDGDIRLDLSSMDFTVGDCPHTLAECVQVAVRMWTAKYHHHRYGDKSAEVVSVVWEILQKAPARATPSSVAHWACLWVINGEHLKGLGRAGNNGRSVDSPNHNRPMERHSIDEHTHIAMHRGNPADLAQFSIDLDAYRASLDTADARFMLDRLLAGHGVNETTREFRWSSPRRAAVMNHLRDRWREFSFATSRTGEFVKELLKAAYTAA